MKFDARAVLARDEGIDAPVTELLCDAGTRSFEFGADAAAAGIPTHIDGEIAVPRKGAALEGGREIGVPQNFPLLFQDEDGEFILERLHAGGEGRRRRHEVFGGDRRLLHIGRVDLQHGGIVPKSSSA